MPLVRIFTCGGLRIETIAHPQDALAEAHYTPLSREQLHVRGITGAQTLLKTLISVPERYRSKDWLATCLHPTAAEDTSGGRLDDLASILRTLLCPAFLEGVHQDVCRKQLVRYVRASAESGNGYHLALYPLVWVDVDALEWNVQQACRMERYGDDSVPFWERAYQLASQGVYLPDEPYADWAEARREAVSGALRQSLSALCRLYPAAFGERGQEEVQRLLRAYVIQFPADEDALRRFMEVLGTHERYQEVEHFFTRAQTHMEQHGEELDARTCDLYAYLAARQLVRQRPARYAPVMNEQTCIRGYEEEVLALLRALPTAITDGILAAMVARKETEE